MKQIQKRIFNFTNMNPHKLTQDLFVSLSIGHLQQFNNHFELINGLKDNNILKTPIVIESLMTLDRGIFSNKMNSTYHNIPLPLSQNQNMSDPVTHSFQMEALYNILMNQSFTQNIQIFDIGCGYGYLTFAIYKILLKLDIGKCKIQITGLDIHETFLENIKKIENQLNLDKNNNISLKFINISLFDLLSQDQNQNDLYKNYFLQSILNEFTILNIGFSLQQSQIDILVQKIKNGAILAPILADGIEQHLTLLKISNNTIISNTKIMKCLFSNALQTPNNEKLFKSIQEQKKIALEQEIQNIKQFIQKWQYDFKLQQGRKPNLQDMEQIQKERDLLQKKQLQVKQFI